MLKHRSDYKPPSARVESAQLDIRIFDDRTFVTTTLSLVRTGNDPFILNGRDLTVHEISIDGRLLDEADWPICPEGLSLDGVPERCVVAIRSECHPETNTALEGLYLSGGMYHAMRA